jgi:hypothetical protein
LFPLAQVSFVAQWQWAGLDKLTTEVKSIESLQLTPQVWGRERNILLHGGDVISVTQIANPLRTSVNMLTAIGYFAANGLSERQLDPS